VAHIVLTSAVAISSITGG